MTTYTLNYGHFNSYSAANAVLKKKFPSATIFRKDDFYYLRIATSFREGMFEKVLESSSDYWADSYEIAEKKNGN